MWCEFCKNVGEINTYDPVTKKYTPILCPKCLGTSKKPPKKKRFKRK